MNKFLSKPVTPDIPLVGYVLCGLIILRPIIDAYANYTVLTIESIQLNANAVLAILVCSWGGLAILNQAVQYRSIQMRKVPGLGWLLGFFIVAAVGIGLSVDQTQTISEIIRLGSFAIIYILAWSISTKNPHYINWVINALAISVIVPIIVAMYQLVTFSGLSFGNLSNRVYGTFGHPNVLGFYLVLVLLIVLVKYISQPTRQRSLAYPWLLVGGTLMLLFTYTRGAWIGLVIGLVVLGIAHYRKPLTISLVSLGMLVLSWQTLNSVIYTMFNVNLTSIPIVSRLTSRDDEADSIDYRLETFISMAPRVLEQPVIGHGLGSFVTLRQQGDIGLLDDPEAHNDYLRLASEVGLLGLALYVIFFMSILRRAIINYAISLKGSWQKHYTLAIIAVVIAFGAMSVSDNILQGTALMWAMMLVLGSGLGVFTTPAVRPISK